MNSSWHRRCNIRLPNRSRHRHEAYRWQESLRDPVTFPFFCLDEGKEANEGAENEPYPGEKKVATSLWCNRVQGEKNYTILKMYLYCFVPPELHRLHRNTLNIEDNESSLSHFYVNLVSSPHCINTSFCTSFDLRNLCQKKRTFYF